MISLIKNIVSLFVFFFLKIFFRKDYKQNKKNLVFYNPEKIGDLTISSVILEYDNIFSDNIEVFFLVKDMYYPLLENYSGKIKIITYSYNKYKWNIFYRFKLIKKIRNLKAEKFFNLTPARGILSDEISVLSGANEIYSISNNKNFLKGIAGRIMDKYYNGVLFGEVKNVYEKHISLLKMFSGGKEVIFKNKKVFKVSESNYLIEKGLVRKNEYIVISPLSSEMDKTWGLERYAKLSNELSEKYKVVLIGSAKERNLLEEVRNGNEKIIVAETTLQDLPGIINYSTLFIGGNSGPAHIALHLGVRFLIIVFGGYFNWYFPYRADEKNNNYIYNYMDCFECGIKCIYDKKYCLENLKYEDVLNEINEILNNPN